MSKVGQAGAQRGVLYVQRQQCVQLREAEGFTPEQVAARLGVTIERVAELLEGVDWRRCEEGRIPLVTLQALVKRVQSRQGRTPEEAARTLGVPVEWVRACIDDGTIRVKHVSWDDRLYISAPMLERLRRAKALPEAPVRRHAGRLRLSAAAALAGVSTSTIIRWALEGSIRREQEPSGWHYLEQDVIDQARTYWKLARWVRDKRPGWLVDEAGA